ncbi:MAG: methyltransferase [Nitrospirae bacterium GWC2_57_9]|nr:MAG: methyltransferase [Nitrospirae bacterium GWC2_57_9]
MTCPLCKAGRTKEFARDGRRTFYQCPVCCLVFVPSSQFLCEADERKRYDLHRNSPDDHGYRSFLSRLFVPLERCLAPGSSGLDFGCGPEPALALMFRQAGHRMALYDQFYEPDRAVLQIQYDFITASEVVEHFRNPRQELERLWNCLKPGGRLGIMTKFPVGREDFPGWHYKNDLTHICFFPQATFAWLAGHWGAELIVPDNGVALFQKKR